MGSDPMAHLNDTAADRVTAVTAIPPQTIQPQTFRFNSSLRIPFISLLIQCPRFNNSAARSQDWGNPDLHRNNLPDFLRIRQSPLRSPENRLLVHPPIQGSHANDACHCSNLSTKLNFVRMSLNLATSKSSPERNMFTRNLSFILPVFTQIAARYSANITFVSTP